MISLDQEACIISFLKLFYVQDLAGDVVHNLHEFFRTMYKKVISFSLIMESLIFM